MKRFLGPYTGEPGDTARGEVRDERARPQVDERELERRRRLLARASGKEDPVQRRAAQLQELAAKSEAASRAWAEERAAQERQRERPRLTNPFDPGPEKPSWAREGASRRQTAPNDATSKSLPPPPAPAVAAPDSRAGEAPRRRSPRRRRRPWKAPRRKVAAAPNEKVLAFARELKWTEERAQRLATRTKRNDAIIAHPSSAEAALRRLDPWAQAAIRRALRDRGWTLADECARRHVAWWATQEEFGSPRAYSRPREITSSTGATRFAGLPKFAIAVVGWTQTALAIALSGPAYSCGGADPIDPKTVQRHTALAVEFGGVQVVVRNPAAPAELRGLPCESNPRGWAINEYWLPSPQFHKPGFVGRWFDADGSPIGLEDALALELVARAKRPRRLRERRSREREQQQLPPPLA